MDHITETRELLAAIGLPKAQQSDICVLTVLGMADIKPETDWSEATNNWLRIHDIIQFANANYPVSYAENSRETFRKQALHHFRTAAIVEDNGKSTNSPNYRWRLTREFVNILQNIGITDAPLKAFLSNHERLVDIYASKKIMEKMPVKINGQDFTFSPGSHNELQKAIIEEFAPRFAPGSECLYGSLHGRRGGGINGKVKFRHSWQRSEVNPCVDRRNDEDAESVAEGIGGLFGSMSADCLKYHRRIA